MSLFFVPFVHPMGDGGGKSVFFQQLGMTGTKDAEKMSVQKRVCFQPRNAFLSDWENGIAGNG